MKVLLAGASGFIGRHVLRVLLARNIEVIAMTRSDPMNELDDENFSIWDYQISLNNKLNNNLLSKVDCFIDLAWEEVNNVHSEAHLNFNFPAHLDFINKITSLGIKNILVLGSCYEYGLCEGAVDETTPTLPVTNYGKAKKELYLKLSKSSKLKNFNLVWGRLFYVYGAGQVETSLYSQLMESLRSNQCTFKMSSGKQKLDYLPVEEASRFIVELTLKKLNLGAINICSGEPMTVLDFVKGTISKEKKSIELDLGAYPDREFEPNNFWGDNGYLQSIIEG